MSDHTRLETLAADFVRAVADWDGDDDAGYDTLISIVLLYRDAFSAALHGADEETRADDEYFRSGTRYPGQ